MVSMRHKVEQLQFQLPRVCRRLSRIPFCESIAQVLLTISMDTLYHTRADNDHAILEPSGQNNSDKNGEVGILHNKNTADKFRRNNHQDA